MDNFLSMYAPSDVSLCSRAVLENLRSAQLVSCLLISTERCAFCAERMK
jgi:hypothetical protein